MKIKNSSNNILKVYCKKSFHYFEKDKQYNVEVITSVFNKNDFITIRTPTHDSVYNIFRFRLDKSTEYIENYIGENEIYFYDYFYSLPEERKNKLIYLNSL